MKIAVLEHFTSLPPPKIGTAIVAEGRAMRDAVVADLRRLRGVAVVVVERHDRFRETLRSADAALVIAPEENGILARLCRAVEKEGLLLLGHSSAAVSDLTDKLATTRCLAAAGVPTPRTDAVPFAAARRLLDLSPPFVVKPRAGCGGRGVTVVRRGSEVGAAVGSVRRATRRSDFLVQEYVGGEPVSVSLIASGGLLDLGLNRQRLLRGPRPAYLGGETFWPHPRAEEAVTAARAAIEALSRARAGVRGYLGVDLVLGRDGAVVIEVNPRLTTSYVGLRRSIRENLAALILDAAAGRALPRRVTPTGRCRFRADGSTTMRRGEWATISAGISAASI
jgi:predicted ATP-grasp superfamily ATP-dependent carboligase